MKDGIWLYLVLTGYGLFAMLVGFGIGYLVYGGS